MTPSRLTRFPLTALTVSAVGLLAAGVFAGLTAGAQDKTGGQPLQYAVTVTLKLVQASVTGKGGEPVTDLDAGEFEVTDNGQRVAVTHFEKHFLAGPGAAPAPAATAASETPRGRKFFLLFDFAFNDARGYNRAKSAALRFMDANLQPEDEVGLISYSARTGLVLHEYLTTDRRRVRGIVESFGQRKVMGRAENLTQYIYTDWMVQEKAPKSTPDNPGAGAYDSDEFLLRQARLQSIQRLDDQARASYADRVRDMIVAFRNLAISLRGIPGYKHVILFSSGISRQALYGKGGGTVVASWGDADQLAKQMRDYDAAQADSGLRDDFSKMVVEFKASNSPIYTLDVSRPAGDREVSDEGVNISAPAREVLGTDSLRQFAGESGGQFFANTVEDDTFASTLQRLTGAYYILGYSVNEKWDGKFHKIEVKVTRKGCKVSAQRGYFDPKPFKDTSGFEKLVQMTDLALSDDPKFQVPQSLPLAALPLTVNGSPGLVAFSRTTRAGLGEAFGKKAEAYLIVTDEAGQISAIKRLPLGFPDSPTETFVPSFLIEAKPGRSVVMVVVRDLNSGRAAKGLASFTIAPVRTGGLQIDPPLLLVAGTGSEDLSSAGPGLSLSRLFGYDAKTYAPLFGDVPAGTAKLLAAVRCPAGGTGGDLEFAAVIREKTASSQAEVPVAVLKQSHDETTGFALLELAPGELKPGRYTIALQAMRKDGLSAVVATEFGVK
jgi:VWFA-related protein